MAKRQENIKASFVDENVGICGLEIYFPRNYVDQSDLEKFNSVDTGKYTIGLGQKEMSFCGDNEDVCSMALTVTAALLENYQIDPYSIGYLAVGTETLIDKSKSIKSVLMDLFQCNTNLQGADIKNACYGGTEALFAAVDWLYANHDYDGRLAIVVCVDIAVYAPGPARCTGGAGAIAFLVGFDAPLVIERGWRAHYATNRYDFYKPVGGLHAGSEFPIVDGSTSLECYLTAVEATYTTLRQVVRRNFKREVCLRDFYAVLFHSPFTKLTQKALALLAFIDFLHNKSGLEKESINGYSNGHGSVRNYDEDHEIIEDLNAVEYDSLVDAEAFQKLRDVNRERWFTRDFSAAIVAASRRLIASRLEPYSEFCCRIGNMYTPSLYAQLIGLIHKSADLTSLSDRRMLLFSYGSGCIASMFTVRFASTKNDETNICGRQNNLEARFTRMRQRVLAAHARLDARKRFAAADYSRILDTRERLIRSDAPYTPVWSKELSCPSSTSSAYYHHCNGVEKASTIEQNSDELAKVEEEKCLRTSKGLVGFSRAKENKPIKASEEPSFDSRIGEEYSDSTNKSEELPTPPELFPGTYYLTYIDDNYRRIYAKVPTKKFK